MPDDRSAKEPPNGSSDGEPSNNSADTRPSQESAAGEPLPAPVAVTPSPAAIPAAKPSPEPLREKDFRRIKRREVLKLAPVLLAGAFAIDKLQTSLLRKGLALSDWASGVFFSRSRRAPTYASSDVVPFDQFPYNGYDVLDPGVDLASWTLKVEGLVARAGQYTLADIQRLPKITQNTRHICVEG